MQACFRAKEHQLSETYHVEVHTGRAPVQAGGNISLRDSLVMLEGIHVLVDLETGLDIGHVSVGEILAKEREHIAVFEN